MRRHPDGLLVETGAKSFSNFLGERHAMDAADLTVTFVRGISHETSNLLMSWEDT